MPVDESGRPYVYPGVPPTGANMLGAPPPQVTPRPDPDGVNPMSAVAPSVPIAPAPTIGTPSIGAPAQGGRSDHLMRLIQQMLGSQGRAPQQGTGATLSGPNPTITSGFAHMFTPQQINQYAYQQPQQLAGIGADGGVTQQPLNWWEKGAQPGAPVPVPVPTKAPSS